MKGSDILDVLKGIKVIEFGEGIAAPLATQFLGDLGAEVIKVERPSGDWGRTMGPGLKDGSYHFISLNRNKRNICIDVKKEEGLKIAYDLIKDADVLITNYRPGALDKIGLGYKDVVKVNSNIIYGRVSGYGYHGELAQRPGSDTVLQAISGIMSHIGEEGEEYYRTGFQVIDHTAARDLLIGVLSALVNRLLGRKPTGPIDISLFATGVGIQAQQWQEYLISGIPPKRVGNKNAVLSPAGVYEVQNGQQITIAVLRDEHFIKFCHALNLSYLLEDERFKTNELRLINRTALDKYLVPLFLTKSKEEWLDFLQKNDILVAPVNTIIDIDKNEQLRAGIDFLKIQKSPLLEKYHLNEIDVVGLPIKFQNKKTKVKYGPAIKGEHSEEILKALGYTEERIRNLSESEVINQLQINANIK